MTTSLPISARPEYVRSFATALCSLALLADVPGARAQTPGFIAVTNAAGYSQNFDIMGPGGSNTPSGWYSNSGTNVIVSDGSTSDSSGFNYGTTGSTDRALGSQSPGTVVQNIDARFENLANASIGSITINYAGEQWRNGGFNGNNEVLNMQYSTNGTTFVNLGAAYNFNTPTDDGTAGPMDGNVASNRVTGIGGTYTPSSAITNGQKFYLRWNNALNGPIGAHGMGIDDLTITFALILPPVVVTLPATNVTGGAATLKGTVNPNGLPTLAWFDWGTTTNFGNQSVATNMGSGLADIDLSATITGLLGQAYFFRAVASNSLGLTFGSNQTFTSPVFTLAVTNLPGLRESDVAWGDYDNDGRLDILLTGTTNSPAPFAQVWRNTVNGFTNINAGLPQVVSSSAAWGDYDNDGWLDILLTGSTGTLSYISQVWRNTGNGFTNINAGLPGVYGGSAAWGDYNNDGRLDLLLAGITGSNYISQVWQNTGGGFTNISAGLPGIGGGTATWGDYNNDGRLDVLLAGSTGGGASTSQVWRNTGNGFVSINAGLPGVYISSAAWGDYDSDGQLDILLTGTTGGLYISQVWRNTGSGFVNINAGLPGVYGGSAAWGDYDNDGRLDFLLTGATGNPPSIAQVWRNTGSGFTNINVNLPGTVIDSTSWGDYDNDGRLDILLTGDTGSVPYIAQIWRNNTPSTNTSPAAPGGLAVSTVSNIVTLAWNAAIDTQSSSGLTYNVRVGTAPGGSDLMGPMAAVDGLRRVPQMGNRQLARSFLCNLPFDQPIYWSVQAVDSAFAGSPFSSESNFRMNSGLLSPASGPVPGDTNGDGLVGESEFDLVISNLTGVVSDDDLQAILAHYWPYSPFLEITNVAGLGSSNVFFALPNPTLGAFSVEVSTNLVNWQFRGPASPRYFFTETNAPLSTQHYYRLRWP